MHNKYGVYAIDQYAYTSQIQKWNASFKILFSCCMICFSIGFQDPLISGIIIFAMGYITVKKGGIPFWEYLHILSIPLVFIFLGTISIGIEFSNVPMGKYSVSLGFIYLYTTMDKGKEMLFLILKVFAAISSLQMLTLSTPSYEIISFLRKVHIPNLIIQLMSLIYRFIFIIFESYRQMKNAAESRLGYCDFKTSCYTFGRIAGNLLLVSLKKATAYYNAMESRCYDGELVIWEEKRNVTGSQIWFACVFIIALVVIWIIRNR